MHLNGMMHIFRKSLCLRKKNPYQEPNMHSQMTGLVLCFMDKMTGNKSLVSPRSGNPVLLRTWNVYLVQKENKHQETWGITKQHFPPGASLVSRSFVEVEGLCCLSWQGRPGTIIQQSEMFVEWCVLRCGFEIFGSNCVNLI